MPLPGTPVIHPRMLAQIQGVAERAQTSTCQIFDGAGAGVLDPVTLAYDYGDTAVLWEGTCRFQPIHARGGGAVVAAGEQPVALDYIQLTIPVSAPDVHVDQRVKITASPATHLVGRTFRIIAVADGDLQGERHLSLEDNQTSRAT